MNFDMVNAILMSIALIIPLFLTVRLDGNIRILMAILTSFVALHGLYHTMEIFDLEIAAESLEMSSVAVLIVFGVIYMKIKRNMRNARR